VGNKLGSMQKTLFIIGARSSLKRKFEYSRRTSNINLCCFFEIEVCWASHDNSLLFLCINACGPNISTMQAKDITFWSITS